MRAFISIFIVLVLGLSTCLKANAYEDPLKDVLSLYRQGKYKQAIKVMESLVSGSQMANSEAHYYYAVMLNKTGQIVEAKRHYKRSLEISPYGHMAELSKKAIANIEKVASGKTKITSSTSKGGRLGYTGLAVKGNLVTRVFDRSPAQKARLMKGDRIVSVDGVKIDEQSKKNVYKRVRGPVGTTVRLQIKRGGKVYGCNLTRAKVEHGVTAIKFPKKGAPSGVKVSNKIKVDIPKANTRVKDKSKDLKFISVKRETKLTAEIKKKVLEALALVSTEVKDDLYTWGLRVKITPAILESFPGFSNSKPRGYIHGGRYDNCGGLFDDKTVFIAEKASMYNHPYQKNAFVKHTLLHEMGHGYDAYNNVTTSAAFLKAYKNDKDRIPNSLLKNYHYFLQPGSAGPSELFAELFAHVYGTNKGIEVHLAHYEKVFPRCTKYVTSILK